MNFLCLGSLFLLCQLNLGLWANYAVKLVGFLLFAAGIRELSELCRMQGDGGKKMVIEGFDLKRSMGELLTSYHGGEEQYSGIRLAVLDKLCRAAVLCAGMCAAAGLCSAAIGFFGLKGIIANIAAIVLGTAAAVMALELFKLVLSFIEHNEKSPVRQTRFCEDISKVHRLKSVFTKVWVCTIVNLACDILNRIVPFTSVQSFFGFFAAISKITLYVFVVMTVYNFNALRIDCNAKTDRDNNENN